MSTLHPEPEDIENLFTRPDGSFQFARWNRPIVPVVFGVEDTSLPPLKGAIETVVAMAGHATAETDPELGTNLMVFFLRDWQELADLEGLDQMIPDLGALVPRLMGAEAGQYRHIRFDDEGAIRAVFAFIRMRGDQARRPAEEIGLDLAVKSMLDWGPEAFAAQPTLLRGEDGVGRLHPMPASVIRAAYDPVLPASAQDRGHALRIYARLGRT
ncbi:hypothetical protein OB2597_15635 [Pseudooceanicola batsensis HTCC2597]|uniref:Uncharacterized protein n=1 Tax=Pseudooceanicola batsensis (strain ATCC BAA-863 / DSM 15984 / KCTC 12145 / HTCC2597) TaxID=252305 RepID=A3TZ09_PSEBH|nr:hypothetical protein [Pseudooceanicola batsensis]EAQ02827.1 hypothetical protein OB2597_15635 [Pseudooceanicola batsensis HTCC2597]